MIPFLEKLNYVPPVIKPYDKNGVVVYKDKDSRWHLTVDGDQMMLYTVGHEQALHFYSHYKLAFGHVICTGLGFGVREQWLATKPEVTKITVLEKYKSVIDYHKDIGTQWSDKIEIINCDANEYKGSCDFLSIDHYETDDTVNTINKIKTTEKNINCSVMWFWLLERWLESGHIVENHKDYDYYHPLEKDDLAAASLYQSYNKLKTFLDLKSLPELNAKQLKEFVDVYHLAVRFKVKTRMDICKECDSYNSKFKLCNECDWFMPAKVLIKESFCPLLKWGPE